MRALFALFVAAFAVACSDPPQQQASHEAPAATLSVADGWAAPTPAGVDVSAGYLTITNGTAAADHLLSATSPRAARVEVHEMAMDGAVMQMRPVERLEIAPGESVHLAPGGRHLMFYGVTQPFADGETIAMQLVFETAGAIDVSLPVRRGAPDTHGAEHGD